ncbi:MAG: putative metal-dependent hydrolase [Saprospiraceae bacterium]|nr:putative metal-dependent hydrolase [Saprospiraceae bacterium]HMW39756.1 putative metal-dependent hydrolase [Saprospiraceae bacterium]HMX89113.1 putative metal-dependent hydrolase [Saprospiraceae bacterium]HMZ41101.1 putative metal-dependent hydrolase [Saprospiraceae bacterium]HNA63445.1 putative metal-dependent hydrolase [Saprospiraceae bacterium]
MDNRYPTGRWQRPESLEHQVLLGWIRQIEKLPEKLEKSLISANSNDMESCYREGGWNLRQVLHHLADSHINAYIRHKLCVTTDFPTINPYPEEKWANLYDVKSVDPMLSVQLLKLLHSRWTEFLSSLTPEDYLRSFYHPGMTRAVPLWESISLYAWHGDHHLAHVYICLKKDLPLTV